MISCKISIFSEVVVAGRVIDIFTYMGRVLFGHIQDGGIWVSCVSGVKGYIVFPGKSCIRCVLVTTL